MPTRHWTCPDCGVAGPANPERVPAAEFPPELLTALHAWARAFDRYSARQGDYTAIDFMHWVIQHQRLHSHETGKHRRIAGRLGLEASTSAA